MLTHEQKIIEWANENIGNDFKFREHQIEVINDIIESVISKKTQTKIIEAPTGSGKSLIAIIAAGVLERYFNKTSYILCSDLYLYSQYETFIKKHPPIKFGMLKGQTGNYECILNGNDVRNAECRIAKIPWSRLFDLGTPEAQKYICSKTCKYVVDRRLAQKAKVTLMTYQLYFFMINVVPNLIGTDAKKAPFSPRDVIFCDECHNIPSIVQSQHTQTVKMSDFDVLGSIYTFNLQLHTGLFSDDAGCPSLRDTWADLDEFKKYFISIWDRLLDDKDSGYLAMLEFNEEIVSKLSSTVDVIEEAIRIRQQTQHKLTRQDYDLYKAASWYRNYHCFMADFIDAIKTCGEGYFVKQISAPEDKDGETAVMLSCAKEDWMCWRYLLSTPLDQAVLLSATVGGHSAFDESVGMKYASKPSTMDVIPSTFDFKNSPIYISKYAYWMTYEKMNANLPKLAAQISSICRSFKGYKGMIQTGSYKMSYNIIDMMPLDVRKRVFIYKNSKDKDIILKKFKNSIDGILIGPTLNEGIDLPDDLCRFIIISKMPYPSLADKLVKKKIELFPKWYASSTASKVIQGIGRGNRNKEDWCITYILDGCFHRLYEETKEQFPEELRARISVL